MKSIEYFTFLTVSNHINLEILKAYKFPKRRNYIKLILNQQVTASNEPNVLITFQVPTERKNI